MSEPTDMGQRIDILCMRADKLTAIYLMQGTHGMRIAGGKLPPHAEEVMKRPTTWQMLTDGIPTDVLQEALVRRQT